MHVVEGGLGGSRVIAGVVALLSQSSLVCVDVKTVKEEKRALKS